jgi:hypothetical protein
MSEREKSIESSMTNAVLSLLALPFTIVKAVMKVRKFIRAAARIAQGAITCPYCASETPLNLMSRCPACGAVAPGSRLYCSFCKNVYDVIMCAGCGASLKVL